MSPTDMKATERAEVMLASDMSNDFSGIPIANRSSVSYPFPNSGMLRIPDLTTYAGEHLIQSG